MKPYQVIGWSMINATAITALVTANSITHGLRPRDSELTSINYYELPGTRSRGFETTPFSINCRANDSDVASDIAREVVELFNGSAQTGIYGTQNGFEISRGSVSLVDGLIPEPTDDIYNAPVTVTIVYPSTTVS